MSDRRLFAVETDPDSFSSSGTFHVAEEGAHHPIGKVQVKWSFRGRGAVTVGDVEHRVEMKYGWRGDQAFLRGEDGAVLVHAQFGKGAYRLDHGGTQYALKKVRNGWILDDGTKEIGTLAWQTLRPVGFWSLESTKYRLLVELPENVPLVTRLFAVWLAVHAECVSRTGST